ncbi:hypothetical protein OG948_51430 (plasmid) [Embleya sp. NBC_00888]|nr:hypothetical protein OG948_51430 [Embleya sp. NBC_00888]
MVEFGHVIVPTGEEVADLVVRFRGAGPRGGAGERGDLVRAVPVAPMQGDQGTRDRGHAPGRFLGLGRRDIGPARLVGRRRAYVRAQP